jgi:hypothetical protein
MGKDATLMDDPNDIGDQVEADLGLHNAEDIAHKVDAHLVAGAFYAGLEQAFAHFTLESGPLENLDQVERALSAMIDCAADAQLCTCAAADLLANLMFRLMVTDGAIRLTRECLAELQAVDDSDEAATRAWAYQRLSGE